jgi:hypothetical protein
MHTAEPFVPQPSASEVEVATGKLKRYKSPGIIQTVILHGCETWSLTLREEHRLRVLEKRVLRRIFGPKRDEVTGEWKCCTMGNFMICTHHPILLGKSDQEE